MKGIQFISHRISYATKAHFYAELSMLIESGVDIRTAIDVILSEGMKENDREEFVFLKKSLISGRSLSLAMGDRNKFSEFEINSIATGEETGMITNVLKELSNFYNSKIKQRRTVIKGLSYPIIVLITAMVAMAFMLNIVVPMFADVFARFKGELPALTRWVVSLSEKFAYWFPILIATSAIVSIFFYSQRKKKWFRHYSAAIILRLPYFGKLLRKTILARFFHSLALLTQTRTPIVRAIELTERMIDFEPMETILQYTKQELVRGTPLSVCLGKYKIFDARTLALLKVAEEVNKLDEVSKTLSTQLQEDMDHQTTLISTALEPAMIIFLGVFIALILVAMYLPMFQLGSMI